MGLKVNKPNSANEANNSYEMPNSFDFGETGGYAPSTTAGIVKYGQPPPEGVGPIRSIMHLAKWEASPDNPVSWAPKGGEKE